MNENVQKMSQDELVGIANLYCESNIVEMPNLSEEEGLVFTALLDAGWSVADAVNMIVDNRNPEDHPTIEPVTDDQIAEPADMRFRVTDESSANWVLRKIAEAQAQLDGLQAMRDAEVAIIDRKMSKLMRPITQTVQYFTLTYEQELASFAAEKIKLGKKKSIALLNGTLGFRKQQDQVVLDIDDETAIELLKSVGDPFGAIKVKETILTTPLKKAMVAQEWDGVITGEELSVQIAHIESRADKFYIDAVLPIDEDVHTPPRRVEARASQEDRED